MDPARQVRVVIVAMTAAVVGLVLVADAPVVVVDATVAHAGLVAPAADVTVVPAAPASCQASKARLAS